MILRFFQEISIIFSCFFGLILPFDSIGMRHCLGQPLEYILLRVIPCSLSRLAQRLHFLVRCLVIRVNTRGRLLNGGGRNITFFVCGRNSQWLLPQNKIIICSPMILRIRMDLFLRTSVIARAHQPVEDRPMTSIHVFWRAWLVASNGDRERLKILRFSDCLFRVSNHTSRHQADWTLWMRGHC